MSQSSSQAQTADRGADLAPRGLGRGASRYLAHLMPAAIVAALMADTITGVIGALAAIAVALVAPGWLLWKLLPTRLDNDPPALPALWVVLSFTVLAPAIGGLTFFGWEAVVVEAYLLVSLVILGVAAARVPTPQVAPWGRWGTGLGATALAAVAFRALTWHGSTDDLAYLGFMRRIVDEGAFPQTNPFLSGELPLPQRWRLDGWTGLTGVVAHLGDANPVNVYLDILPAVLVLVGASALFILARTLSGSYRFACIAALSGLLVPLSTAVGAGRKTDFKFWYSSIAQNKYAALIIFMPVAAALLIAAYRSRHRITALAGALALWAELFVHPLPAVFTVLVFSVYVMVDLAVNRSDEWKAAVSFSLVMMLPLIVTAVGVSSTGGSFGTRLSDVDDVSEIAYVGHSVGPIEILLVRPGKIKSADASEAAAVFIGGHSYNSGQPRIALLGNGLPVAHWQVLGNPGNLIVVLAAALILLGRHRDPVALWILAATLVAVSVFVLPPLAAIVARFITPWLLWRFAWLIPVPLATAWLIGNWLQGTRWTRSGSAAIAVVFTIVFMTSSHSALFRTGPSRSDQSTEAAVAELEGLQGVLLGNGIVSNWAVSTNSDLKAVKFRGLATMANNFPASRRGEALERFQDVRKFYSNSTRAAERLAILDRHDVAYVLMSTTELEALDPESLGLEKVKNIGNDIVLYVRPAAL